LLTPLKLSHAGHRTQMKESVKIKIEIPEEVGKENDKNENSPNT